MSLKRAAVSFIQISLDTIDTGATVRLYEEVFGFAKTGAKAGWDYAAEVRG